MVTLCFLEALSELLVIPLLSEVHVVFILFVGEKEGQDSPMLYMWIFIPLKSPWITDTTMLEKW